MTPGLSWTCALALAVPGSALAFLATPAAGQESVPAAEMQVVEVRVTSAQPRATVIDRGSADGLAKGDRVVLRPRDGSHIEGTIVRIGERAAVVEPDDATFVPAPGTRGEVRVPLARFAPVERPALEQPAAQDTPPELPPEHPPWERVDDDWTEEQPLLARVRPLRPRERDPRFTGRMYTSLDFIDGSEGDTRDTFARAGVDFLYENAFGAGGDLHLDAEVNYRDTDVPDGQGDEDEVLRIDRLSYAWGGHRFAPDRMEVGRFLQREMPEFGVLDGAEWNRRLESGDVVGASVGFLPEPDRRQRTGRDLSLATWYRWVADESELLSVTGGFQKTFHNFDADRDLFVAKVLYLPADTWSFSGTAWVDLYTSGDEAKGSGPEITQAYVTTGRRWQSGSALRATYTHLAFPELERDEFEPVLLQDLADAHNDRLSIYGRQALGRTVAIFGQVGGWHDETGDGVDAEAGFDVDDLLFDGSRIEVAGFGTEGRFVTTAGWRASLALLEERTAWRVGYEFTLNRIEGFQSDNNDIPQHRARASWERHGDSGWGFSAHADVVFYDSETAVLTGLLLQRSF